MINISEREGAVIFEVQVQPGASRTEVAGQVGAALKIKLSAPPVEGKANEQCERFLAELFGVARRAVTIIRGMQSRKKLIRVEGMTAEAAREALTALKPRPGRAPAQ